MRIKVKQLESECYQNYINSVENSIKINPKNFWRFIKTRSSNSNIPNTVRSGDTVGTGGGDICDLFAQYFFQHFYIPQFKFNRL